ncbi:MAG TPA: hypothetical protein VKB38_18935 [Terracidiphilus sp.]|nr:hypothetical protein [Terracidiphilus sp.]
MRIFHSAKLAFLFLIVVVALPGCFAQASLAGDWPGILEAGDSQYHIVWHVKAAADGSLTSTVDNIDQSVFGIKVKKTEVKGSDVTFDIDDVIDANGQQINVAGKFEGKLNSDQTELDGNWMQTAPNESGPLALKLKHQAGAAATTASGTAAAPAAQGAAPAAQTSPAPAAGHAGVAGDWKGVLMGQLHLDLHIKAGADGTLTATLDSVDQGANGIPVSAIALKDGKLTMAVDAVPGTGKYDGTVSKDGNEIDGNWSQGTQGPIPLNFTRTPAPPPQPATAPAPTPKGF